MLPFFMLPYAPISGYSMHMGYEKTSQNKDPQTSNLISREISLASASTIRTHRDCIFKATADCATGVWCVFMSVYQIPNNGPDMTSVAKKYLGHDAPPRGEKEASAVKSLRRPNKVWQRAVQYLD